MGVAVAWFLVACGSPAAPVEPPRAEPPPEPATEMAREQLFFAGEGADPTLLAIVLQRVRDGAGASIEAKAFLVWDGAWHAPFWERVAVPVWPGTGVDAAIAAWGEARGGRSLRVEWVDGDRGLHVRLRAPDGGIAIDAPTLTDAGVGRDPHGAVAWRTGPATIDVNGAVRSGLVVVESLVAPAEATPSFGTFEMWVTAPSSGVLALERRTLLSTNDPGEVLRATASGATIEPAFPLQVTEVRPDAASGFALPSAWQHGEQGPAYARIDGEIGRGVGPRGQPAAYDVAFARQIGGPGAALVFHLQDTPQDAR